MNWHSNSGREGTCDTVFCESSARGGTEIVPTEASHPALVVADENLDVAPSVGESTATRSESTSRPVERADDPKPEGHDRMSPTISSMVGAAFVIPLSLIVLELTGALASNAYVFLIAIPLIAALLFALAMQLRRKYVTLRSLGEKGDKYRLSAHFHRLQILLYIYFRASLMISFGFALTLSASAILGWVGIILSGGGIVVGIGVGVVLLILYALYLILWRKDPTGIKPPRDPHPGKDG